MVCVRFSRRGGHVVGFVVDGHAGQAEYGRDLVCAAVSALTQVTALGLQQIAKADVALEQRAGFLSCRLRSQPSLQTDTLLESLALGLQEIAHDQPDFVRVEGATAPCV